MKINQGFVNPGLALQFVATIHRQISFVPQLLPRSARALYVVAELLSFQSRQAVPGEGLARGFLVVEGGGRW